VKFMQALPRRRYFDFESHVVAGTTGPTILLIVEPFGNINKEGKCIYTETFELVVALPPALL